MRYAADACPEATRRAEPSPALPLARKIAEQDKLAGLCELSPSHSNNRRRPRNSQQASALTTTAAMESSAAASALFAGADIDEETRAKIRNFEALKLSALEAQRALCDPPAR